MPILQAGQTVGPDRVEDVEIIQEGVLSWSESARALYYKIYASQEGLRNLNTGATLSLIMYAGVNSFTPSDISVFEVGFFYAIEDEVIKITNIDFDAGTVTCLRKQKATVESDHEATTIIYRDPFNLLADTSKEETQTLSFTDEGYISSNWYKVSGVDSKDEGLLSDGNRSVDNTFTRRIFGSVESFPGVGKEDVKVTASSDDYATSSIAIANENRFVTNIKEEVFTDALGEWELYLPVSSAIAGGKFTIVIQKGSETIISTKSAFTISDDEGDIFYEDI